MPTDMMIGIVVGAFLHSAAVFACVYFSLKRVVTGPRRALFAGCISWAGYGLFLLFKLAQESWSIGQENILALILLAALFSVFLSLWTWRTYVSDQREALSGQEKT